MTATDTAFLVQEAAILGTLKEGLHQVWVSSRYTFPVEQSLSSGNALTSLDDFLAKGKSEAANTPPPPTSSTYPPAAAKGGSRRRLDGAEAAEDAAMEEETRGGAPSSRPAMPTVLPQRSLPAATLGAALSLQRFAADSASGKHSNTDVEQAQQDGFFQEAAWLPGDTVDEEEEEKGEGEEEEEKGEGETRCHCPGHTDNGSHGTLHDTEEGHRAMLPQQSTQPSEIIDVCMDDGMGEEERNAGQGGSAAPAEAALSFEAWCDSDERRQESDLERGPSPATHPRKRTKIPAPQYETVNLSSILNGFRLRRERQQVSSPAAASPLHSVQAFDGAKGYEAERLLTRTLTRVSSCKCCLYCLQSCQRRRHGTMFTGKIQANARCWPIQFRLHHCKIGQ